MKPAALVVEGLRKAYREARGGARVEAVGEIGFEVGAGEVVVLVGPSGCGKSTLLNLLAGFEAPDAGRVLADGRPVAGPDPGRVVVFQQAALFPWMTVADNVGFGLDVAGVPAAERDARVRRLVEDVGLGGAENRYPRELSGGMRQRAALARALAVDPGVLLLDEPFAALDAQSRTRMVGELERLQARTGKTVVLVTHDVEEAVRLADRVLVLTARPARVREVVAVTAPRPRDLYGDPVLAETIHRIERAIEG